VIERSPTKSLKVPSTSCVEPPTVFAKILAVVEQQSPPQGFLMSIDPFKEDVFPVSQTPKRLRGRRVHPSTVWRWVQRGLRGHKLETIKVGGVTCTSEAALLRFFSALTKTPPPSPAKDDADRQAQIERELKAFKI
jgi:Protein of unknown function (DUF1580)